jgi:hypothetical protein
MEPSADTGSLRDLSHLCNSRASRRARERRLSGATNVTLDRLGKHRHARDPLLPGGLSARACHHEEMVLSEVATGIGLAAYGSGFGYLLNRYRTRPELRLRVAQSRWRIDQSTARRRGLSQEQWFAEYAESQRRLVQWLGLPFTAVFVAVSLVELVHGLLH